MFLLFYFISGYFSPGATFWGAGATCGPISMETASLELSASPTRSVKGYERPSASRPLKVHQKLTKCTGHRAQIPLVFKCRNNTLKGNSLPTLQLIRHARATHSFLSEMQHQIHSKRCGDVTISLQRNRHRTSNLSV